MIHEKQIRVVIIEDDTTIREGFTYLINAVVNYKVVSSYSNVEDALKSLSSDRPQVVLLCVLAHVVILPSFFLVLTLLIVSFAFSAVSFCHFLSGAAVESL